MLAIKKLQQAAGDLVITRDIFGEKNNLEKNLCMWWSDPVPKDEEAHMYFFMSYILEKTKR